MTIFEQLNLCDRDGDSSTAFKVSFEDQNGDPIDITNYEFYLEVRAMGRQVIRRTLGDGLRIEDNALVIERVDTLELAAGRYSWAVKYKSPDGEVVTFIDEAYMVREEKVANN